MKEKKLLTESEFKALIEYWYSKYCSCELRLERELYLKAYTSLKDIFDLYVKENRFTEDETLKIG